MVFAAWLFFAVGCDRVGPEIVSEPGAWGSDRWLREEIRIGVEGGPEALSFGEIDRIAVGPLGEIFVYDILHDWVVKFDGAGSFVGRVGASGRGPGEFDGLWGLDVDHEGRVLLATTSDEILVFGPEGELVEQVRIQGRLYPADPLAVNADSTVTLGLLLVPSAVDRRATVGFVRFTPGAPPPDTFRAAPTPWEAQIVPGVPGTASFPFLRWSRQGFAVSAVGSRVAVQMEWADGRIVRVERPADPVGFLPEERQELKSYLQFLRDRSGQAARFPDPPDSKPPVRDLIASHTGEVWVHRTAPSTGPEPGRPETVAGLPAMPRWEEPSRFDVFDQDGRYLGAVRGGPGIAVHVVRGDTVWARVRGRLGVEHVSRFVAEPCRDPC